MNFPLEQLATQEINWQKTLLIAVFFIGAYILHRLAWLIAVPFVQLHGMTPRREKPGPARLTALRGLLSGLISAIVFAAAILVSLSLFVEATTLVWVVGLFSAAFGLGARPLVSDFLSGVSFIFEDTFGVGEKVEMPVTGANSVEGVIEAVNLRATLVRSPTGELFTVPNGEIRVVRNFSRGHFSRADVSIRLKAEDLNTGLPLLEELGEEAVVLLPNLLEPWQVISTSPEAGQQVELTLVTRARFGKGAEMRPRMLALIKERLEAVGIELVG